MKPKPNPDSPFARQLRAELAANGYTAKELAEKIGVTQAVMSAYCRGVNEPPIQTLIRLADALGCTLDHLVGRAPKT